MLPISHPNEKKSLPFTLQNWIIHFRNKKLFKCIVKSSWEDIVFHSVLAFALLLNTTKVTSKRTGIKCCLLEDKSSHIIAVSHLPCIFKHLAPNISIKWLQETFGKHSASPAFINRLDWLLENTPLTDPCWGESRGTGYAFWRRVIKGCVFYNGADYGLQLCFVYECVTFITWGFKNNISLKVNIWLIEKMRHRKGQRIPPACLSGSGRPAERE